MSYKATNWAYDLPLGGPQKAVIVALADMADESGSCFPGHEKISAMTGWSVSTVARSLKELESRGLIKRTHRQGAMGYRTSDRYHLQLTVSLPELLPVTEPTRQKSLKADSESLPVRESIPTGQSDGAIEPSVEPLEEPSDSKPPKKGRTPSTPLPDSWSPNEVAIAFAREHRIDLQHEVGQFRAQVAATDRRQANWDAAFRLWLGNVVKWSKPAGAPLTTPPKRKFVAHAD
jgi:DNA-binding transcriptional MocR family regulator